MKRFIPLLIAAVSASPGFADTAIQSFDNDSSLTGGSLIHASKWVEHCGWGNCPNDRSDLAADLLGIVVVGNDCSRTAVDQFIGHNISITETMPDLFMRVFSPDFLIATMDYWPNRFNFMTDDEGTITGVSCG